MPVPAAAHVAVWFALGGGLAYAVVANRDLQARLDRVEAEKAEAPAASTSTAPTALAGGKETADLEAKARADEALKKLEAAFSEIKQIRSDHDRLVATVMAMPAGEKAAEEGSKFVERPGFEDAVRSVVDRYAQEQKFRDTLKKATGPLVPKKPMYAELAKVLKLTSTQSTRFEEDIRGIQGELFQILQVPRDDGVVPIEEIQQAEQYPEGNPKKAEAFLKLIKLTIPGTQETYFERAMALVGRVKKSTESYLDEGQRDVLNTIDLDWFGIKMQ